MQMAKAWADSTKEDKNQISRADQMKNNDTILDSADKDLDDAGAIEDEQSPPAELATSSKWLISKASKQQISSVELTTTINAGGKQC